MKKTKKIPQRMRHSGHDKVFWLLPTLYNVVIKRGDCNGFTATIPTTWSESSFCPSFFQ